MCSTAVLALIAVSRYRFGAALEEQASRTSGPLSDAVVADDERTSRFVEILRQVTDAGPDDEFELGLGALIRGLDERRSVKNRDE